jgi:hypothetical protein
VVTREPETIEGEQVAGPSSRDYGADDRALSDDPDRTRGQRIQGKGPGAPKEPSRYIQFQVAAHVSDLLDRRADEDDLVLGEVVMDAIRAFNASGPPAGTARRRRRTRNPVRRSVLVRSGEAREVETVAAQHGLSQSGLVRTALESYLAK